MSHIASQYVLQAVIKNPKAPHDEHEVRSQYAPLNRFGRPKDEVAVVDCNGAPIGPPRVCDVKNNNSMPLVAVEPITAPNAIDNEPKDDLTNFIDSVSRVAFPSSFVMFNICYWFYFIIRHEYNSQ